MFLDKLFCSLKKRGGAGSFLSLQIVDKLKDGCLFLERKSIDGINEVLAGHPEVSIPRQRKVGFSPSCGPLNE